MILAPIFGVFGLVCAGLVYLYVVRQPIGTDRMREIELSFVLNRSDWGQGIATEAVAALRDHGFQACGFQRLVSLLHPDNTASERVARKIGMTFDRDVHSITQSLSLFAIHRP